MKFITNKKNNRIPENGIVIAPTVREEKGFEVHGFCFYEGKWYGDWITITDEEMDEDSFREASDIVGDQLSNIIEKLKKK